MKLYFAAAAIAVLLPSAAFAQAPPTPAPKAEMQCCCEKMDRKMACCEEHMKKDKDGQSRVRRP
jgi:hypothetical protein